MMIGHNRMEFTELNQQVLKLKHAQLWLRRRLGENHKNSSTLNARKRKQLYEVLLYTLSGIQCMQTDPRPSWPTCHHSAWLR